MLVNQPILQLFREYQTQKASNGIKGVCGLDDCAFPLLPGIFTASIAIQVTCFSQDVDICPPRYVYRPRDR